ncbi:hypothetical protein L249_7390 [Ophiocordyceps polyrhachis-furcata BCC 54312]|uniref:Uncharacterized protein n=1 Tax=Ophiocordyceps polyrhachis-furcata BCC 54312 TaxID=1330021 RepID=A0A367LAD4_9HYPO|nr:hypothetical protein L249_7390 [Ophiocordyceps polyrhachis-furcata BCC 54312]
MLSVWIYRKLNTNNSTCLPMLSRYDYPDPYAYDYDPA